MHIFTPVAHFQGLTGGKILKHFGDTTDKKN